MDPAAYEILTIFDGGGKPAHHGRLKNSGINHSKGLKGAR